MSTDDGFIDLRLNVQEGQNQESFWPSFTDIMTVVVMIFMIAMVVLLLRNIELVNQLRATMTAEREAMELARSTGEEKENISLRLMAAENELAIRRMQQRELDEVNRDQKRLIIDQTDLIARLKMEIDTLIRSKAQLTSESESLTQRLERANVRVQSLQQDQQHLQQDLSSTRQQLKSSKRQLASMENDVASLQQLQQTTRKEYDALQRTFTERTEELQQAKAAMRSSGFKLNSLQGEYDKLRVEYDKLFRPARSPEGRYQVIVRYSKADGAPRIEFTTDALSGYESISRAELERRLTRLKAEKPNGLYVKVVFPENSGLTYNEAWKFTSELHARYDYYSQPKVPEPDLPLKNNEQEDPVQPSQKP
jgi:chromosome segregation ATPase